MSLGSGYEFKYSFLLLFSEESVFGALVIRVTRFFGEILIAMGFQS